MVTNGIRRRGKQRGAIYVESLIVVSLITVILACTVYVTSLYEHKLAEWRNATAQAWLTAEQGCGQPAGGLLNSPGNLETSPPPSVTSEWPDPTFLGPFLNEIITISESDNKPAIMGGGTISMTTSDQVLCADPEVPGAGNPQNPLGAVTWAVGSLQTATGL